MRTVVLCGVLATLGTLSSSAQSFSSPRAVVEVGDFVLDESFSLFVTGGGRILAYAPAPEGAQPPQKALWDGLTGTQIVNTLRPMEARNASEVTFWDCCGSNLEFTWSATVCPNQCEPSWDATNQSFPLPRQVDEAPLALTVSGALIPVHAAASETASVQIQSRERLRVVAASGDAWEIDRPSGVPAELDSTSLQSRLSGEPGFSQILASRDGAWVITTWAGAIPNPERGAQLYIRDRNPRCLLWRRGDTEPVMDLPLGAILGAGEPCERMILNQAGDRVILVTPSRVVVLDPSRQEVLMNRQGAFVTEIPAGHALILVASVEGGSRFTQIDLNDGQRLGELRVPGTLDLPAFESLTLKVAQAQEVESDPSDLSRFPRSLGWAAAFSPDGRYLVTPRYRRGGAGWDGLVLWEFERD